jgi:small-conductance mechanosensitive channel
MNPRSSLVRSVWAVLAAVALAIGAAFAVEAAESAAPSAATATLPSPLTPEAIRELVSRLPDEEVRKLLIEQLDRTAAKTLQTGQGASGTAMLNMVDREARSARQGLDELLEAVRRLPAATQVVVQKLAEPDGPAVFVRLFGMLAGAFALAALVEWLARALSRRWRQSLRSLQSSGALSDALRLLLRIALELAYVAIFGAVVLAMFFALWQGHELRRSLVLGLLAAVVVARAVAAIAGVLLAPRDAQARLLPLDDATAATLATYATALTALFGLGTAVLHTYAPAGVEPLVIEAISLLVGVVGVAATLFIVWKVRKSIGALIRRAGNGGPIAGWIADLWPVAAAVYVLALLAGRTWEAISGAPPTRGAGLLSLLILIAIPTVDFGLCRLLASATSAARPDGPPSLSRLLTSYDPVVRKLIHILVVVTGLAMIADVWDLDLFGIAQRSLGGRIASSLLGIGIVVLLAYIAWEIARTAIDRRLAAEPEAEHGVATTRLRTLLPLLRAVILVTIVVMATLSVLAALGVEILPLLAGAGVVGVAIGFGSQTLVRDIVSGAFFLMDDAFRLGEYIEVGESKGRVEKITTRALFLRHHRGALNVLPYGEIKRLRNTSRDWIILVLEFKLALDTDMKKVKKLVKAVGEEIAADPEVGPNLIEPLKSQGVLSTDESSVTVRVKYTAKPGNAPFVIRRLAYEKILKAFRENGIEFASKRVAVYVPPEAGTDRRAIAGAAAHQVTDAMPKDPNAAGGR